MNWDYMVKLPAEDWNREFQGPKAVNAISSLEVMHPWAACAQVTATNIHAANPNWMRFAGADKSTM